MPLTELDTWTLTAEFDTIAETIANRTYEGGLGEAAEFWQHCREQAEREWGFLNEEIGEAVTMDGETVTVSLNMLEPLTDLLGWIVAWSTPRKVTITRNSNWLGQETSS